MHVKNKLKNGDGARLRIHVNGTFTHVLTAKTLLKDSPVGSTGDANLSGWMKEHKFLKFTKHDEDYNEKKNRFCFFSLAYKIFFN